MTEGVGGQAGTRDVRALTFDVFGTTVDWRTGVSAEARRLGEKAGVDADWERLADMWRALYMPYMNRVRSGELPWTNFDRLHRLSLDQVLRELDVDGFDGAAREELTAAWERLPPWPDAVQGLERLGKRLSALRSCLSSASCPQRTSTITSPTPRCTWEAWLRWASSLPR
jgi:2-haloalkanoic acid dehalogenase type II